MLREFSPRPLVTSPSQYIVVSSSRGACAQIRKQMPGGVLVIFTAQKVDTLVAVLAHYVRVHVSRSGKLTAQSRSRCTGTALAIRSRSQISRPQTPDPSSHQKSREGPLPAPMNLHTIYARVLLPNPYYVGTGPVSHCRVRYLIIGCMSTPFQYLHYAPGSTG